MSDTSRASAAHDPKRASGERDAVSNAKTAIDGAYNAYESGSAGVAKLIGRLRIAVDDLSEAVFEGSGRGSYEDRIVALLEANNREVERRRAAEQR